MMNKSNRRLHISIRGFTIIELMVTIAIAAIIATFAAPSFRNFTIRQQVTSSAQTFYLSILEARSEAVKRNGGVSIIPKDATDWSQGWVVTSNGKTYAQCVANASGCHKIQQAIPGIKVDGAPASIQYSGNGRLALGVSVAIDVCNADASSFVKKLQISVATSGLPKVEENGSCS